MKKRAILVDIHGTLLDKDGKPNQPLIDLVNNYHDQLDILLITAEDFYDKDELKTELQQQLKDAKIKFSKILISAFDTSGKSDCEVKQIIYHDQIEDKYSIDWTMENNKKCAKMWQKMGLLSLQVRHKDE